MIDVDNFKQINDKFGHVEGDNALIIVADALKSGCQNYNSILSRYGGDEFAIICEINIDDDIKTLCRNIYNILESKSAELPYDLNLSIGFAKCSGDAKMTQEIIKAADAQLYKEKHEKNYPYLYELKHILCAKYRKKMFYGGGAMKKKIAFFDTKQYDRTWFDRINEHHGYEIVYFEAKLSEHTAQLANGFDAVCAFVNDDVNGSVIDILYNAGIRVLAMRCAGYNNVDVRAAEGRITILSVPAYSPHAVAEHSMALLQTLNRKLHKAYNRTRDFNFSLVGLTGTDLCGKTAGVIGTGKIGRVFIDICRGYGMKVLGYDLYPAENSGIEYVELDRLFQESDVISLHCPLTLQTKHIINEAAFQKMKEGVFIINTSRGALIDSTALLAALKNGKVKGAGLDVYEEEADIFFEDFSGTIIQDDVLSLLIASPNVLITSHQGFLTEEALENISKITLRNLDNFFGGQNQNLI